MAASISKQLIATALTHLRDNVSLDEMDLSPTDRNRIERVKYMMFLVDRDPTMDVFAKFKRLAAGRYDTAMDDWHEAKKDMILYEAVAKP